jgi:hypothetical protein
MDELDLVPEDERPGVARLAGRLSAERPVPAPGFRGDLRRSLVAAAASRAAGLSRPRRWAVALSTGAGGTGLLAVAALGVAGVGPLAA